MKIVMRGSGEDIKSPSRKHARFYLCRFMLFVLLTRNSFAARKGYFCHQTQSR